MQAIKTGFATEMACESLVHNIEWQHQPAFQAAGLLPWSPLGTHAGWVREYGQLTYVEIADAGHWCPWISRRVAGFLLNSWLAGVAPTLDACLSRKYPGQ